MQKLCDACKEAPATMVDTDCWHIGFAGDETYWFYCLECFKAKLEVKP